MNEEYISVSTMAKYLGISSQQVYNKLHAGEIGGIEFARGSMRGWLCYKPADYDAWQDRNTTKE